MKYLLILSLLFFSGCKEEKTVEIEINGKKVRINKKIDMNSAMRKARLAKIKSRLKQFSTSAEISKFTGIVKSFEDTKKVDEDFYETFPKLQSSAGYMDKETSKFKYEFTNNKWTGEKIPWIIVEVKFDSNGAIYRLTANQDRTITTKE